ncbi:hypothetical protein Droror1_Dr00006654 [Drosera rotundifolia]
MQLDCPSDVQQGVSPSDDNRHRHLEDVGISGFYGTLKQIEFVMFWLNHAPVLKKLFIFRWIIGMGHLLFSGTFRLCSKSGRQSWNDGESEKACNGLSSITRKDVEVVIQDP